jgi:hypothetical protein
MNVMVAGVRAYIPMELQHPDDVEKDGQGGVTRDTYDRIVYNTKVELRARLDFEGVAMVHRDHDLLNDVAELLVAARICRRMRIHQETADSLFAEANMKLRIFYESIAGVIEGEGEIELVGDTQTPDRWEIELADLSEAFLDKAV